MPSRSLRLILHGKAAADPLLREAVAAARTEGIDITVRSTWEQGHTEIFTREAVEQGIDVVVAGGGDGTVNAVVAALCAEGAAPATALSILPLGTANDFARSLNYPLADPLAAIKLAAEGKISKIDVGRVNGQLFINVASGGFGAEVTTRTPEELKTALGGVAYTIIGLATALQLTPYPCRALFMGEQFERDIVLVAVGNGKQAGGGFQVAPRAELADGLLDLVLVPAVTFPELGQLASELMNVGVEENQYILYRQLSSFELHFADEFQFNLDGEPLRATRFTFDILPQHLPLILPP